MCFFNISENETSVFGKEINWILGLHINSVIASINYSLVCFGGLRLLRNKQCPSVELHASCALLSRTSLSTCGSQILLCTVEQAKALLKGDSSQVLCPSLWDYLVRIQKVFMLLEWRASTFT